MKKKSDSILFISPNNNFLKLQIFRFRKMSNYVFALLTFCLQFSKLSNFHFIRSMLLSYYFNRIILYFLFFNRVIISHLELDNSWIIVRINKVRVPLAPFKEQIKTNAIILDRPGSIFL